MKKRLVAGLLALVILISGLPFMAFALQTDTEIHGEDEIVLADGVYRFTEDVSEITIVGSGDGTANAVRFDCTQAPGIHLTLRDVNISVESGSILSFSGKENILTAEGTNLLESTETDPEITLICTGTGTELTFDGTGGLYLYSGLSVDAAGTYTVNGATVSLEGGSVGGIWYVNGGSIRADWAEDAQIRNSEAEALYLCVVDVFDVEDQTYTVMEGDTLLYSGSGYGWSHSAEGWTQERDDSLYLYLTGEDHVLTVNGTERTYYWDPLLECFDVVPHTVASFAVTPADAKIVVSDGIGYTYTENTHEGKRVDELTRFSLSEGSYTATITRDGCYASQFSFRVTEDGRVTSIDTSSNVKHYLDSEGVFTISLGSFTQSANPGAWDGVTLDVSWYNENAAELYVSTPAQLAGMAAITNGIYNAEITTILDDADGDGRKESYTPAQYAALENRKIRPVCIGEESDRVNGGNQVTTSSYWYGARSTGTFVHNGAELPLAADFSGQTIYLTADLDMGGYQSGETWTGARYMTIGGQSLMHYIDYAARESDGYSHIGSSFNGHLEGQGHIVKNIYCDRNASGSNYGDSSSVGLIGRLGNHDNDPGSIMAVDPSVRNVAVTGYVYGRRSVGGIVGKIGQTSASKLKDGSTGGIIENCLNLCTVRNTDAKGVGGICGAAWNQGVIRNCANLGSVYAAYKNAGGISGSCEVDVINCYNAGYVSAVSIDYAQALGTDNGGADFINCYWLTGSSYADSDDSYRYPAVYRDSSKDSITEITSFAQMAGASFLADLNGDGRAWVAASESQRISSMLASVGFENCKLDTAGVTAAGFPVPRAFVEDSSVATKIEKLSDPDKLSYVEGQSFDPTGLRIQATFSDGTTELVTDYTVSPGGPLQLSDTSVTVSGIHSGMAFSYEFPIEVRAREVVAIAIATAPINTIYAADEQIDLTGLEIAAYYSDAPEEAVILDGDAYTTALDGDRLTVSYTWKGVTVTAGMTFTRLSAPAPKLNQGFYELSCANDLTWFANQVGNLKNNTIGGRLTADITTDELFTGIGRPGAYYAGTFDGNGHTVTLDLHTEGTAGLFTGVSGATITNMTVAGSVRSSSSSSGIAGIAAYVGINGATITGCVNEAKITGGGYVGGIVGKAAGTNTTVTGCENRGTVTGIADYAGGICGYVINQATISGCANTGTVSGADRVGGIVGYASGTGADAFVSILGCGNEGAVHGATAVGGILGYSECEFDSLRSCFDAASVTASALAGNSGVGGLAGFFAGQMDYCYNCGPVSCTGNAVSGETQSAGVGGLVGVAYAGDLDSCYNSGSILTDGSSRVRSGGIVGYVYYGTSRAANTWYLEEDDLEAVGGAINAASTLTGDYAFVTSDQLKTLAQTLGGEFRDQSDEDYHGGYPGLAWENIDHIPVWDGGVVTREPGCTEPGERTYACTDGCGITMTEEIKALGHRPDEGVVSKAATCIHSGEMRYTCTVCGEAWTEPLALAEHSYSSAVTKATCTQGGCTLHTCRVCGDSYTDSVTKALGHSWNAGTTTIGASCVSGGQKTCRCTRSGCGASKTEEVSALGHKWNSGTVTRAASCTEPGEKTVSCTRSGCGLIKVQAVEALGHDYQAVEEAGVMRQVCKVCGDGDAGETESEPEHQWDEGVVTAEAACTEAGEMTYTCTDFGETRTEEIRKTGHRFEDGVCTSCGETEATGGEPSEEGGGHGLMWIVFLALLVLAGVILHRLKIFR